jgi:hypothetical protein
MNKLINYLLIATSFLIVGCSSNDNSYKVSRNLEKTLESPTLKPETTEQFNSTPSTKIETLDDFERSAFYRDYKLRKGDGWKLNTGAYNNSYETSSLSDVSIEVQTIDSKVIGFGIIFHERSQQSLQDSELNFVYKLLESIDTKVKLDSRVKEYIKTNAEKSVFQIKQATPINFGRFKIYAGKVIEQTISIEKI